jgi:Ca2+-binding EF-hand superfamily protein
MVALTPEELAELREDFAYNDADGNGRLSFDEFVDLLDDLESGIEDDEARVGFAEIDRDEDGAIEFDEFVAWWTSD